MEDSKKPALAILIGNALAKKGKAKVHDELGGDAEPAESDGVHEQLVQVADDLLKAFEEKDSDQIASLLEETFECIAGK